MDVPTHSLGGEGSNDSTFCSPVFKGATLASLYAHHAANSPNHPLMVYDDNGSVHTIRYPEAHRAIRRSAAWVNAHISENLAAQYRSERMRTREPAIIGLLSAAGLQALSHDIHRADLPCRHDFNLDNINWCHAP